MADSHTNETKENKKNTWKYLSIALMGILAIGLTLPQANAATDISQLTQQILNIVKSPSYGNQAIMNAINGLGSSTATGADVDNLDDKIDNLADKSGAFQIHRARLNNISENTDIVTCQSDQDFLLHITLRGGPTSNVDVYSSGQFVASLNHGTNDDTSYTIGGLAGETLTLQPVDDDAINVILGTVTLQTSVGATASCISS